MNHKNRTSFEIAAMVAMILGGVWKRHAVTLDENEGGRLQYVPWYRVRQQLCDEGRYQLADDLDVFFKSGEYGENLGELLSSILKQQAVVTGMWRYKALQYYANKEVIVRS